MGRLLSYATHIILRNFNIYEPQTATYIALCIQLFIIKVVWTVFACKGNAILINISNFCENFPHCIWSAVGKANYIWTLYENKIL